MSDFVYFVSRQTVSIGLWELFLTVEALEPVCRQECATWLEKSNREVEDGDRCARKAVVLRLVLV